MLRGEEEGEGEEGRQGDNVTGKVNRGSTYKTAEVQDYDRTCRLPMLTTTR